MYQIQRTSSDNRDFRKLVDELDKELAIMDGEEYSFYAQFNKLSLIEHAVVIFDNEVAVGCGAIKEYDDVTMEVKRMFVPVNERGKGIASRVLNELEIWAKDLGFKKCLLETGSKQIEAIGLYKKHKYKIIDNYGQYADVKNSICFEKILE
jgi:GNAT superfamily N-acetyltransferase